jgi:hypothetical protein
MLKVIALVLSLDKCRFYLFPSIRGKCIQIKLKPKEQLTSSNIDI